MKCVVLVLGICIAAASVVGAKQARGAATGFRIFSAGDREIEAQVVSVDVQRGTVTLELQNQQRKKVKSSIFSAKDQAYIAEHALIQEFQSARFKLELEKVVVEKRRETPSHGVRRDVEKICYEIQVSNNTPVRMEGVSISYNVFSEQEHLGRGQNDTKRYCLSGTIQLNAMAPRAKTQAKTDTFEIYNQKLGGGYDYYSSGAPYPQSGKSKGIWVKVLIKTPSGLTAEKEMCVPKNTSSQFSWRQPE